MNDETLDDTSESLAGAGEASEFERLAQEIEENPGSPSFPRLAEAYRRAGHVERAESIAKGGLAEAPERMGGRVALALAMIDKGEITMASKELASILENVPELPSDSTAPESVSLEHRLYSTPLATPSEALPQFDEDRGNNASEDALRQEEIDHAFDSARTDADQMISANQLAESAMLDVSNDVDSDDACPDVITTDTAGNDDVASCDHGEGYSASGRKVFATETMANLLEGQGDLEGAERVRASMPDEGPDEAPDEAEDVESATEPEADATTDPDVSADAAATAPLMDLVGAPLAESPVPAAAELDLHPDLRSELHLDPDSARDERATRIIHQLEGWLANIRRDVA